MKRVTLTQGKEALVDDSDFELVSQYKWYAHRDGNTYYAYKGTWKGGETRGYIHAPIPTWTWVRG